MNSRSLLVCMVMGVSSAFCPAAGAQWLQDEKYWGDGKAEFNIYDAQEVRYGQPRTSEVIHIYVREPFSDRELVKAEPGSESSTFPVLKLNQILRVPTGIYAYQQMHSAFWRTDNAQLIKATLTSNDSCGNTYKEFRALAGPAAWLGARWRYEWRTYWEGQSKGEETIRAPRYAMFYDELPMRMRLLAARLNQSSGTSKELVNLGSSIIHSKKGHTRFVEGELEASKTEAMLDTGVPQFEWHIDVRVAGKTDSFVVNAAPPFVLREWRKHDGGSLKLRRSLKIDYWNYNKVGDAERAFAIEPAE